MRTRWPAPHPWFGPTVELVGGKGGHGLDLGMVSETLAGEGMTPEQAPPPLNEVQPARAFGNHLDVDARVLGQPLRDRRTGVTGEIVGNQVEGTSRILAVDRIKQCLESNRVAGGSSLGEDLAVAGAQGAVDPDFIRSTTVV